MLRNKLGYRIAWVVALSILVIELAISFVTVFVQERSIRDQRLESLRFSIGLLAPRVARDIRHSNFQNLSPTLSALGAGYNAYAFTLVDPQGRVLLQQSLKEGYPNRVEDLKAQLQLVADQKVSPARTSKGPEGEVLRYLIPLRNDQGALIGGLELETSMASLDASTRALIWKEAIKTLLLVLLVMMIITPFLFYIVVRPINVMKDEMEALSKGDADLTFQIQVTSRDEIGEMAHSFNSFIGRIRAMVLRVMEHSQHLSEEVKTMTHSTSEVSAMSGDVTTTVQQIAKGAEEQASKIAEVNHLMQEVQETMKEVEKKAMETSTAVDKATQTAKIGGKLAHGTIDKMAELNNVILKNSKMVGHLGQKSQEVGRAVEIINGIAEQTNLLSLNAAIEAARAGEQGRGFTVVAEEIRLLADGANRATQEITSLVQEIQDETSAVVESMEKGAREAQVGKDSIRQMENSLDEIITVIENVVQHSKSITSLIGAQAQRYTKILHSIQDINAVSEQSAASTEEVSASTEEQSASMEQVSATCKELAAMSEELKSMVEKFKIR